MLTDPPDRLRSALADRYRLERELGRGGTAAVYLATDLRHDRPVALKVLNPELAVSVGPERFLHEIRTTARLTHPHILPLLDSGEADGFLYCVMPYVAGESLRARLDKEKQLPVDEALRIAREVADALSYAHAQGVIHRDIKPANILLEAGHAVVADFGIARAIDVAGGTRMTETGITLGTPAYMSPEQAAGERDLIVRVDLRAVRQSTDGVDAGRCLREGRARGFGCRPLQALGGLPARSDFHDQSPRSHARIRQPPGRTPVRQTRQIRDRNHALARLPGGFHGSRSRIRVDGGTGKGGTGKAGRTIVEGIRDMPVCHTSRGPNGQSAGRK